MRNRPQFEHSFKVNGSIPKVSKTPIRNRSCECQECGARNKKMLYIGSIISFQPYQNIAHKLFESEKKVLEKLTKIQQQKQLRLRNKRHNHNKDMLKKAVNAITFQDNLKKKQVELPPLNVCSMKDIHSKINTLQVLPQRKLWDKRQTTIKFLYASNIGHEKKCQLPAAPLDPSLSARIDKVIYQQYHLRHQQGTADDFNYKLRLNVHEEKPENQQIKHHLVVPPIHQEDSYDEEESLIESVQHMPIKKTPREEPYKQILKYNKRSFANLVEQASLTERKVIRNIIKANNSHRAIPMMHDSLQLMPISIYLMLRRVLKGKIVLNNCIRLKSQQLKPRVSILESRLNLDIKKHQPLDLQFSGLDDLVNLFIIMKRFSSKFYFSLIEKIDNYGCLHVNNQYLNNYLNDTNKFRNDLNLLQKEYQNLNAIWITLRKNQMILAQVIADSGFDMHHCTEDYLLFSQWLSKDESRLPNFASHIVKVSYLLKNSKDEVFLIDDNLPQEIVNDKALIPQMAIEYFKKNYNINTSAKSISIMEQNSDNADIHFLLYLQVENIINSNFKTKNIPESNQYEINDFDKYIIFRKQ